SFADDGMTSVVLGQTPRGPALLGVALALLGVTALVACTGQRRRLALALWSVIVVTGLIVSATAAGLIPPLVSSPVDAGVLAALSFAGLAGLAAGSFRMDLPQRGFGRVHAATLMGLALASLLAASGVVPALWRGEWSPGSDRGRTNALIAQEVRSIFAADAQQVGQFRALWVGDKWSSEDPRVAIPDTEHFLTGPRGHVLTDLFERDTGPGDEALDRVIASVEEGTTDRAGRLLGAFNIRYVVLERRSGVHRWLNQRDLALARDQPAYILLQNQHELRRIALYNEVPVYVRALMADDPALSSRAAEIERSSGVQTSASSYRAADVSGPGVVFLAENAHDRWTATLDGAELDEAEGGWGNAFAVPPAARGTLEVRFPRAPADLVWLLVVPVAWIVAIGGAFSRRRPPATEPG
ncbi:MAG TPA: hypothetical protein VG929_02560, partial [Actinomycetota bacterium]|nr:hypothetical protein [Actinomycetota bacterium]